MSNKFSSCKKNFQLCIIDGANSSFCCPLDILMSEKKLKMQMQKTFSEAPQKETSL